MKNFRIEMMTNADYNRFMCGYNDYCVIRETVQAETAEQAYEIACKMFNCYVVNEFVVEEK